MYETLGWTILRSFTSGFGSGGTPGFRALTTSPAGHNLARISETEETIQIGNPFTQTVTIDLEIRPLGIPSDWIITLSQDSVTLAPSEQVSVTITIQPGLPAVQGTQPGIAVEGFVDGVLVSGVAMNVVVPSYVDYTHPFKVYLPMLSR
jgi:hypothetical protein